MNISKSPPPEMFNAAASGKMALDKLIQAAEELNATARRDQVTELYRIWLEKTNSDSKFVAWFNYGVLLADRGDTETAAQAYREAIDQKNDFVQPRINLGLILERQGKKLEAIKQWEDIAENEVVSKTATKELLTTALNHIGRVQEDLRQYAQAEATLTRSLALNPRQNDVIHHWVHLRQKQCKWPVLQELPGVSVNNMLRAMSPLAMLAYADDPALQLLAAENCVKNKFKYVEKDLSKGRVYQHTRIRLGYLSCDLCTHAVGLLLPEVFENHDKTRFEIFAYDFSREDGSITRERIKKAFEHFKPIGHLNDSEVAEVILSDEIDILIDMQGLSLGARPGILAQRPAPVQVTYIGYIGTTAMPWIDYVITDRYSLQKDQLAYYSEKPIYLDCPAIPGDSQREIGVTPTRIEVGLPTDAFVFASFNNSYKLNEQIFKCWMEILKQVPNSVLWLVDDNPEATQNLKQAANRFGVAETRLVFSGRVLPKDYRARMLLADLFLDNAPYNAGSTASDVIWMGLPMLTLSGRTFVSRMAGSLLHYAGLDELIADTLETYQTKAVQLAQDGTRVKQIREKLQDYRRGTGRQLAKYFAESLENSLSDCLSKGSINQATHPAPLPMHSEKPNAAPKFEGTNTIKLLIEGWRNINHSFAIVNQNQILALSKIPDVRIYHRDHPFFLPHWKQTKEGSGFSDDEVKTINQFKDCSNEDADIIYRIGSPIPLVVPGIRNATFIVTELGLSQSSFVPSNDSIKRYTNEGNTVITPSTWSKARIIDYGFDESAVHVVPHGVNQEIFYPSNNEERERQRSVLGIQRHELVLLNVGVPLWNKGTDVLIKATAKAINAGKNIKLLIKNNKALYGLGLDQILSKVNADAPGLLNEKIVRSILVIDSSLTLEQLRALYCLADVYVSPYRAEGFNLPVLEAMACGTRVVVTHGGSTDDFVTEADGEKIPSKLLTMDAGPKEKGKYLEPDLGALVDILISANPKYDVKPLSRINSSGLHSWDRVAKQLVTTISAT
jgi:predicted O-linked N-acetylglucosamine transferase (SPINDLY family)